MTKDILKLIGEGAKWLGIGGGACLVALATNGLIATLFSDKIRTNEELENMLKEEIPKLELNDKKISAEFGVAISHLGNVKKLKDGSYEIVLNSFGMNRATLRHELYHIHKGDCEHNSFIRYFFLEEPRAALYESLGIKL